MQTPVLLISFNRPTHTKEAIKSILACRPDNIYIFQDGPRNNETDKQKCLEVREVISEALSGLPINLHTFFSETNMGCGPGPAAGITWFFSNVEQGIIIEDDTIPHPDFFVYAEYLLNKYKNNNDVRAIGSMNVDGVKHGDGSYYFSRMNRNLCAWATWKRAWKDFDIRMLNTSSSELNNVLKIKYGCKLREREYWIDRLEEVHKDGIGGSSWDMQFFMSIWLHEGKGIMPNVNLSTNIGFDNQGTHTTSAENIAANRKAEKILPLFNPTNDAIDREADYAFHKLYFTPYEYGISGIKRLPFRLNKRLKNLFNHKGPWIKR